MLATNLNRGVEVGIADILCMEVTCLSVHLLWRYINNTYNNILHDMVILILDRN